MLQSLQAHQVLRFQGNQIRIEDSYIRRQKPFLIRLFTNRQYNENRILSALLTTAEKTNDAAKRAQCIDWAEELIKRSHQENPIRARLVILIRWLKGTPLILIQLFQDRLQKLKKNEPASETAPVIPAQGAYKVFTKSEMVDLMNEALKQCQAFPNHRKILLNWIRLTEKQEILIAKAKELYQKNNWELCKFVERETGFSFYLDLNNPILSLENAPRDYARAYNAVRHDLEERNAFFKAVFTGNWPCFAGNYRELTEWNEAHDYLNQDLIPQTAFGKSKTDNVAALYNAYQGHLIREYHKLYLNVTFKPTNPEHQKNYNALKNGSNEIINQFVEGKGQQGFMDFIKEHKHLPVISKDGEVKEENLQEEVEKFYELVF